MISDRRDNARAFNAAGARRAARRALPRDAFP